MNHRHEIIYCCRQLKSNGEREIRGQRSAPHRLPIWFISLRFPHIFSFALKRFYVLFFLFASRNKIVIKKKIHTLRTAPRARSVQQRQGHPISLRKYRISVSGGRFGARSAHSNHFIRMIYAAVYGISFANPSRSGRDNKNPESKDQNEADSRLSIGGYNRL